MADLKFVLPGDSLGLSKSYTSGAGTHVSSNQISASLVGMVQTGPSTSSKSQPILSVKHHLPSTITTNILPEVDSVVLARVNRIGKNMANVGILVVGDQVVGEEWAGVIRVQDVRATEKDKVKVQDSFRVGDIVRAVVISLGDQSNYYLSTARNEYGVIMAASEVGNAMFPVSWKEYQDPTTGQREARKVAKPF